MAKRSASRSSVRLLFAALGGLVLIVMAVQALLIQQLFIRTDRLGDGEIKNVLIDAIGSLDNSPTIDSTTNRQLVPDARLVFPASPDHRWYYRGGGERGIWFTDSQNRLLAIGKIRSAQSTGETFREVSAAQVCSRQVGITFGPVSADMVNSSDKLELTTTKKLRDGRTAYFYQNMKCAYGSEFLLGYLKQVDSY